MNLSPKQINTQLFAQDQKEFDRIREKNGCSEAELVRRIVHERIKRWRLQNRDSGDLEMSLEETYENSLVKQIEPLKEAVGNLQTLVNSMSEMLAARSALQHPNDAAETDSKDELQGKLQGLLELVRSEFSSTHQALSQTTQKLLLSTTEQGERLSLNEALLERLTTVCKANYFLTGQTFATGWATLDFVQRYIVEPMLENTKPDPYEEAITQRDAVRKEGVQMVVKMSEEYKFPGTLIVKICVPIEGKV
jgi:hypothetical protein